MKMGKLGIRGVDQFINWQISQQTITCSKLTRETLDQGVKVTQT